MNHATFGAPDLTTFARLDELGLEVTGQLISAEEAVLACRVVETDEWCHRCGCQGIPRDTVVRRLALRFPPDRGGLAAMRRPGRASRWSARN